jgi:hypothetical protein
MNDQRLLRHLVVAVVAKLALLGALWAVFVHPQSAHVDATAAAAHLFSDPPAATGAATDRPGDPQ